MGRTVLPSAFPLTMIDFRRRLPHWVPDAVPVFVTFRLAGTLPAHRKSLVTLPTSAGMRFLQTDRQLDRAGIGPVWLRDQRVAEMLVKALRYGSEIKRWYELHAYVIMPNHVHVIWTPRMSMSRILQWFKGATAYRAKRLLGLAEKAFWQDESYDHWIRSDRELQKIIRYVELNPVKAALVKGVEDWPWSSAYIGAEADGKTVRPTMAGFGLSQ